MDKSTTRGQLRSLLHLGYSVRNREETMDFLCEKLQAKSWKTQRADAPYIGSVNGVKGAIAELAFIEYGDEYPMIELLAFENPPSHTIREYKPGEPSYFQIGFRAADIMACYDDMTRKGIVPLGPPARIDYGYGKGRMAFLMKDSLNMYVQVVQAEQYEQGALGVVNQDHTVMSVANLDEAIPVFRDLLECDVSVENVADSEYLASYCAKPVERVAICKSRLEDYTVELWETGATGGVEELHINLPGSVHLCYLCEGIDDLYERFTAAGMRFVNEPVTVTKGVNAGSKAIFFQTPGYLWVELLCRKDKL